MQLEERVGEIGLAPMDFMSRAYGVFGKYVIDGIVNATGSVTGEIAGWWRTMQTGSVQNYALIAAAGAMAVAILFLLRSFT